MAGKPELKINILYLHILTGSQVKGTSFNPSPDDIVLHGFSCNQPENPVKMKRRIGSCL